MKNLLAFGDFSDFIRKLINNKVDVRIYDDQGYANHITIVGMVAIKDYPDVLVQYVDTDDEDVDDALEKYISCKFVSDLFKNGFDIFTDDQAYLFPESDEDGHYCFDYNDCKHDNVEEEIHDCHCGYCGYCDELDEDDNDNDTEDYYIEDNEDNQKEKIKPKNSDTLRTDFQSLEDAVAELMEAIFNPETYSHYKKNSKNSKDNK